MVLRALVLTALLLSGCVPLQFLDPSAGEPDLGMVPTSPFGTRAPIVMTPVTTNFAAAPWETSIRVDKVGNTIVAKNPEIGNRPLFGTIGDPRPEIFHQGTYAIQITAGLVKECKTDGVLAAVLCLELGKMVAEREALAGAKARAFEERLPLGVPIGNSGQFTAPDQVAVAELGKYEEQRKQAGRSVRPPDPHVLARRYLEKAGYSKRDLDTAKPLLDAAEKNYIFEKQFRSSSSQTWTPATPE
jgi:hypothetical protein